MSEKAIRYGRIVIDGLMAWKLAAFNCLNKATIAMLGAFVAQVGAGMTTEKWLAMGALERGAVVGGLLLTFLMTVDSFLDKTVERIQRRLGKDGEGQTEFITKP